MYSSNTMNEKSLSDYNELKQRNKLLNNQLIVEHKKIDLINKDLTEARKIIALYEQKYKGRVVYNSMDDELVDLKNKIKKFQFLQVNQIQKIKNYSDGKIENIDDLINKIKKDSTSMEHLQQKFKKQKDELKNQKNLVSLIKNSINTNDIEDLNDGEVIFKIQNLNVQNKIVEELKKTYDIDDPKDVNRIINEKIERMQNKINALEQKEKQLSNEMQTKSSENQNNVKIIQEDTNKLTSENETLKEFVVDCMKTLEIQCDETKEPSCIINEIKSIKNTMDGIKGYLFGKKPNSDSNILKKIKDIKATNLSTVVDLKNRIKTISSELEESQQKLEKQINENKNITNELSMSQQKIELYKDNKNKLSELNQSLQSEFETINENLREQIAQNENSNEELKNKLNESRIQIQEYEEKIKKLEKTIENQVNVQINDNSSDLQKVERQLQSKINENVALKNKHQIIFNEHEQLKNRLNQTELKCINQYTHLLRQNERISFLFKTFIFGSNNKKTNLKSVSMITDDELKKELQKLDLIERVSSKNKNTNLKSMITDDELQEEIDKLDFLQKGVTIQSIIKNYEKLIERVHSNQFVKGEKMYYENLNDIENGIERLNSNISSIFDKINQEWINKSGCIPKGIHKSKLNSAQKLICVEKYIDSLGDIYAIKSNDSFSFKIPIEKETIEQKSEKIKTDSNEKQFFDDVLNLQLSDDLAKEKPFILEDYKNQVIDLLKAYSISHIQSVEIISKLMNILKFGDGENDYDNVLQKITENQQTMDLIESKLSNGDQEILKKILEKIENNEQVINQKDDEINQNKNAMKETTEELKTKEKLINDYKNAINGNSVSKPNQNIEEISKIKSILETNKQLELNQSNLQSTESEKSTQIQQLTKDLGDKEEKIKKLDGEKKDFVSSLSYIYNTLNLPTNKTGINDDNYQTIIKETLSEYSGLSEKLIGIISKLMELLSIDCKSSEDYECILKEIELNETEMAKIKNKIGFTTENNLLKQIYEKLIQNEKELNENKKIISDFENVFMKPESISSENQTIKNIKQLFNEKNLLQSKLENTQTNESEKDKKINDLQSKIQDQQTQITDQSDSYKKVFDHLTNIISRLMVIIPLDCPENTDYTCIIEDLTNKQSIMQNIRRSLPNKSTGNVLQDILLHMKDFDARKKEIDEIKIINSYVKNVNKKHVAEVKNIAFGNSKESQSFNDCVKIIDEFKHLFFGKSYQNESLILKKESKTSITDLWKIYAVAIHDKHTIGNDEIINWYIKQYDGISGLLKNDLNLLNKKDKFIDKIKQTMSYSTVGDDESFAKSLKTDIEQLFNQMSKKLLENNTEDSQNEIIKQMVELKNKDSFYEFNAKYPGNMNMIQFMIQMNEIIFKKVDENKIQNENQLQNKHTEEIEKLNSNIELNKTTIKQLENDVSQKDQQIEQLQTNLEANKSQNDELTSFLVNCIKELGIDCKQIKDQDCILNQIKENEQKIKKLEKENQTLISEKQKVEKKLNSAKTSQQNISNELNGYKKGNQEMNDINKNLESILKNVQKILFGDEDKYETNNIVDSIQILLGNWKQKIDNIYTFIDRDQIYKQEIHKSKCMENTNEDKYDQKLSCIQIFLEKLNYVYGSKLSKSIGYSVKNKIKFEKVIKNLTKNASYLMKNTTNNDTFEPGVAIHYFIDSKQVKELLTILIQDFDKEKDIREYLKNEKTIAYWIEKANEKLESNKSEIAKLKNENNTQKQIYEFTTRQTLEKQQNDQRLNENFSKLEKEITDTYESIKKSFSHHKIKIENQQKENEKTSIGKLKNIFYFNQKIKEKLIENQKKSLNSLSDQSINIIETLIQHSVKKKEQASKEIKGQGLTRIEEDRYKYVYGNQNVDNVVKTLNKSFEDSGDINEKIKHIHDFYLHENEIIDTAILIAYIYREMFFHDKTKYLAALKSTVSRNSFDLIFVQWMFMSIFHSLKRESKK